VSVKDTANILMVTIADYLEQMVDMSGWKDHHQIECPDVLYPGDGKLSWKSSGYRPWPKRLLVIWMSFHKSLIIVPNSSCTKTRYRQKVIVQESSLEVQEQCKERVERAPPRFYPWSQVILLPVNQRLDVTTRSCGYLALDGMG
jgi:hypothetical protein